MINAMDKIKALLAKHNLKPKDLKPALLDAYNELAAKAANLASKTALYNEKVELEEQMADDDPDLEALQQEIDALNTETDELTAEIPELDKKLTQKVQGWITGTKNKESGKLFQKKGEETPAPEPTPAPAPVPVEEVAAPVEIPQPAPAPTAEMPTGPVEEVVAEQVETPTGAPAAAAVPIVEKKKDNGVAGVVLGAVFLVCTFGLVNYFSNKE
jgi:regulator of replication initiation timing